MMPRPVLCLARVVATAISATPFVCAAQSETSSGVNVSGNVEYASNPFLVSGSDTEALRGRVSLSPYVEERTSRSSLRVAGNASFSKYSRRYGETVDLATQVSYNNQLTRRLSVRAGMSLNSSIGGANNLNPTFGAPLLPDFGGSNPTDGVSNPPSIVLNPPNNAIPQIVDITLIGSQERTTQVAANTGLTYAINDKNSLSLGLNGSVVRYPETTNRNEYSSVGQNISYSRVFNSRASAGASVSVSRINYFGGSLGDATIISPSIDGTFRVGESWTVSGSVGLSSSRVNTGFGRLESTDLSGSLNMCRAKVRTNLCLNASRSTAASSFDGIRTTTTTGASYSYRINSTDTFSASGGYSRSTLPRQFTGLSVSGMATDYLSAAGTYSRRLTDRMAGQITGGFARSNFQGTRSNAHASIGVNYSFGKR